MRAQVAATLSWDPKDLEGDPFVWQGSFWVAGLSDVL